MEFITTICLQAKMRPSSLRRSLFPIGFADKEAERVDEEIFYYTSESDLKLPDNELVAILSESNPDWFD